MTTPSQSTKLARVRNLLTEIAEGRGPFSLDNHRFAQNVIEHSKACARTVLSILDKPEAEEAGIPELIHLINTAVFSGEEGKTLVRKMLHTEELLKEARQQRDEAVSLVRELVGESPKQPGLSRRAEGFLARLDARSGDGK